MQLFLIRTRLNKNLLRSAQIGRILLRIRSDFCLVFLIRFAQTLLKKFGPITAIWGQKKSEQIPSDPQIWLIAAKSSIHGFIDGYSWLIIGLCAHNNNHGQTVLDLFLSACTIYGVSSHLHGDHGVENILCGCLDGRKSW